MTDKPVSFWCIPNLLSKRVFPCNPWEHADRKVLPDGIITNKKLRHVWVADLKTEHQIYSPWEGLSAFARVTKKGRDPETGEDNEDNPPLYCHGFMADFDAKLTPEEVAGGFERLTPHLPQYYGVSLSGKCHLVWVFNKPLRVGSWELAEAFLKLAETKLKLRGCLPSFDPKFIEPQMHLTNGCEWYVINENRFSHALALGWLVESSAQINYATRGYNVPLHVVKAELDKNPAFAAQWKDIEFVLGAQGPTWWVGDSESPKSATVKESGMFTFSSHAPKEFYSWGELIGFSFVDEYKSKHAGDAVAGVHYDGMNFWREISRGDWKGENVETIMRYLKHTKGLSAKTAPGEQSSELDLAYEFIVDQNRIDGAMPFVFKKNGRIDINGKPYLNTHTRRVMRPVDQPVEWGHSDHFPFISQMIGPLMDETSKDRFWLRGDGLATQHLISWISYFYRSAYELNLRSGTNIFIAGPKNMGKTLFNQKILGAIMGGTASALAYLMKEDAFGSELFESAHWAIDDGTMSTALSAHRRFGEMLKSMAANDTFRYHCKFRVPQQVNWEGRVVVTLNNDAGSARLLPNLEMTIMDKIELYSTNDIPTVSFPTRDELERILAKELPYFCRFLLQWKTPPHCLQLNEFGHVDNRFGGIKPWHDEELVRTANQSSRTSGFNEILHDWKTEYFETANSSSTAAGQPVTSWRGSALQLYKVLGANPSVQSLMRGWDNDDISRNLEQLKVKGARLDCEEVDGIRYWTIYSSEAKSPDSSPDKVSGPLNSATSGTHSKFSK